MAEITTSDVHLFYDDLGTGPAVIFSHSWFCDRRQWPQVQRVVDAGFRVLNLDNRGHGRSGAHHEADSVWDMAEDLVAVLDDAGVHEAVVAGLSVGGFAAIRMALGHPGRVRALVLADTAASAQDMKGRLKAFALGPVWLSPARRLVLPQVVNTLFGPTARRHQPQLVAEWKQRFMAQDPRSMLVALRAVTHRDDVTPRLGELPMPAMVVVGEEDRNPGVQASASLAAHLPDARLIPLPDTGHLSALEQPDAFADALIGFVSGL